MNVNPFSALVALTNAPETGSPVALLTAPVMVLRICAGDVAAVVANNVEISAIREIPRITYVAVAEVNCIFTSLSSHIMYCEPPAGSTHIIFLAMFGSKQWEPGCNSQVNLRL